MTKSKIDKSSQTQDHSEEGNVKSYYLRPRRKLIKYKYKKHFKTIKNNLQRRSSFQNQVQVLKNENSSSSFHLPRDSESLNSNSNRSSTTQVESSRSKSSYILTSDEEGNDLTKEEDIKIPLSSSLTLIKKTRKSSKLVRPQTCPSSLCLRMVPSNLTLNRKQMKISRLDEENHPQRAAASLSDVVSRQEKSYFETAHQSATDRGLKLRFPRKRSMRTSLKDVSSSSKSKRRLIKSSNRNSRDEEERNFLDLYSGSVDPMSNDCASDAYLTVMVQQEKERLVEENLIRDKSDATFKLKKSESSLMMDQKEQKQGFQDRGEFIFDKNFQLMTKYFKDAIHALHESIIIKMEKESNGSRSDKETICCGDKQEASGLFSKMEKIVGTNEDAEKNKEDPEPGVEREVDRFRNLLEKISMLRGDVTILLEDAGKNDKTLEFFRNFKNFSRSSSPEVQDLSLMEETGGRNLIGNSPRNPAQKVSQIEPQIEPQNLSLQNLTQIELKDSSIKENISVDTIQDLSQNLSQNIPQVRPGNDLSHGDARQSKLDNISMIDEDDEVQILKVISNRNRPNFYHSETNHLDGDYHFLMSLYQQLKRMPQGRKLKMRLKMQQLFYEEICTVDSD